MIRSIVIVIAIISLAACKSPEARRPVERTSGTFIQESAERNKKIIEQEEALIASIIKSDSLNHYMASESGFWYFYNIQDTTATLRPKLGDEVSFTYDVKYLNGEVVFSTDDNGIQMYKVDQSNQDLISGIRDGIKLMKEGETVTFLFPSHKAFGYYGLEDKIGTNIPIQSTVSLKSINSTDNN